MVNRAFKTSIYFFTAITAILLAVLLVFLYKEAHPFFVNHGVFDFIFGSDWNARDINGSFQIFNILKGSFYIAFLACIISSPLAFGVSIYICFYSPQKIKKMLLWTIGLLAGIPSITYGFFALFVIVKDLEKLFSMSAGESVLAGAIILSIMILPFFVSTFVETLEIIKLKYEKDSNSLGVSKEYFIRKVVIRECRFSMVTGFILASARAVGETMAVMMAIGNTPLVPKLLGKAQTIPSLIALEIGMSEVGSEHYSALFAAGFVLLLLVLAINLVFFVLVQKRNNKYGKV
ncbi:MAG: phosphate ABC transporter permease subunit PstC [Tissierellia bacterium]|nr:phosphate ABC transporter permease subunit PstC [Tissierellia bacterium]